MFIKLKKIFECFSYFWKLFLCLKFFQKSKNVALCVFATHSRIKLQSQANYENLQDLFYKILLTRGVHDSLASGPLSREKHLEFFFKIFRKLGFSGFQPEAFVTHLQLIGKWKSQSRKRLRKISIF